MAESKNAPARHLVGDVIAGRYRIDSVAGEGGMGIVYEAEHVILRQRVALKVLLPGALSSVEALERFSVEASAIARISCEHVVRVMDAGTLPNGQPYLAMEYLEGQNLEELLMLRGPLPVTQAVDYALQTLEALAHVHAAHVIHRDLKSANLFLARVPDGRRIIKLLDFGVAMTSEGIDDDRVVGSPAYMAPEQLRKEPIDPRTDLWALGVVLYELLSGSVPFVGELGQLIQAVMHGTAAPLHEKARAVSPALSAVIARCLARDPAKRWASASELARALAPFGSNSAATIVERIDRALANTAKVGERRRFESLENALHALDSRAENKNDIATEPPVSSSPAAFGETIPAPPTPRNSPRTTRRDALRIAMLDEDLAVLRTTSEHLKSAGFDVRTTTTASDLDALIDTWKPHLVLVDVPRESEDRLCKRLKAKFKATLPIIIVSNMPPNELELRAKEENADAGLSKSSEGEELVEFVRNICAMTYSPEHLP